eukprot:GILI01003136.1.p1 GENE.GILI01003136.1~~GILI01003136.1.p1  ORF type:complete len:218 (+),score=70.77 GILI01003136.1:50-655(+)
MAFFLSQRASLLARPVLSSSSSFSYAVRPFSISSSSVEVAVSASVKDRMPAKIAQKFFLNKTMNPIDKIIGLITKKGNKSAAEKIMYQVFLKIKEKHKVRPSLYIRDVINNLSPPVEIKQSKKGTQVINVPIPVTREKQIKTSLRWIVEAAMGRKEDKMADRLFREMEDVINNQGSAIKKKKELLKLAFENRGLAHYRWSK